MPALVYSLCFMTSAICAGLLLRAFVRTKTRLLLWSAIAFIFLAINNFFVLGDMILFPTIDLLVFRYAAALASVCVLIYGFIWEVE
jgi:hypothetical protein